MTRKTDVLVVGAGPAGLAAATAAATHGRTVVVLDDSPAAGGQIWRAGVDEKRRNIAAGSRAIAAFNRSRAELLPGRRVFDVSKDGFVRALVETADGPQAELFEYKHLVLATGARERFLPFPGWTLPGVFGAGGLQALVKGGFSVQGKRVVIAGSGPLLLAVAVHLQEYGARVVCIAEQASRTKLLPFAATLLAHPAKLFQGARYRAALALVPYRTGCWIVAVEGSDKVSSVRLTDGRRTWEEACDLVACGFHLVPNTELPALLGCRFGGDFVQVNQAQQSSLGNILCAGEPTGIAGVDAACVQGQIAGLVAAGQETKAAALYGRRDRERIFGLKLNASFELRPELCALAEPRTIVCRCEDVRFEQLQSQSSWTDAKLQTRCGMGACQGRVCGPAVQTLFGWRATSVRSPVFPVPISVLVSNNVSAMTTVTDLQEIP